MRAVLVTGIMLAVGGCSNAPSGRAPVSSNGPGGEPLAEVVPPSLLDLDGTTWDVRVEPPGDGDGGSVAYDDDLKFESRHIGSRVLRSRGYVSASYSTWPQQGPISFLATWMKPDGEQVAIEGQANARVIWGTMTLRRPDWTSQAFRFRGRPAPGGKAK